MSEPYRATISSIIFEGEGVVEVIQLVSGSSEASQLTVYDSEENEGIAGRLIYSLAAVAGDSRNSPSSLNIPIIDNCYVSISGSNAQVIITKR